MAILKASGTAFNRKGYRLRETRDRKIIMKQDTQWIKLVMKKEQRSTDGWKRTVLIESPKYSTA